MNATHSAASSVSPVSPSSFTEILNVEQAALFLSMTKRQVWEMTRARGQARMPIPIPVIRVNGNIRFKRSSLQKWIDDLERYEQTGKLPVESGVRQ